MTTDSLNAWEKWPIAGLVASAGVNTAIWYVGATLGGPLPLATQIMVTLAAVASVVAIDGALIATIAGMRAGRRSFWSAMNIVVAALFTGLAALSAHGVLPKVGPWLHGFFAVTLVTYAMHLAQPRLSEPVNDRQGDVNVTVNNLTLPGEMLTPEVNAIDDRRTRVKALVDSGMTVKDAASSVGVSRQTASKYVKGN